MVSKSLKTAQAVIFLHIVKTAGTTIHRIIERNYQPEEMYWIGTDFRTFDHFTSMSDEGRAQIRVLRGHMVFGMHEHLPGTFTYFTLLRDPVERAISYYYFIRRTPEHHCHDLIVSNGMSLKEFVESGADILIVNGQTRVLAGGKWHDECTEEAVEAAKKNLREYFAVVGLVERFDETLYLLKRVFGWRGLYYTRQNVGTNRPEIDELTPATLDAVVRANQLDVQLYQYAAQLFEEQIRQQNALFSLEVRLFRLVNRCWGRLPRRK
jgi:hypothetical protein